MLLVEGNDSSPLHPPTIGVDVLSEDEEEEEQEEEGEEEEDDDDDESDAAHSPRAALVTNFNPG